MAHVSYITGFMIFAMGALRGGAVKQAMVFGERCVLKRLEAGANKKDLFYYLVRQCINCLTCSLR